MAARRGKTPPYEIMRSATRPTGGGDVPASSSAPSQPAARSSLSAGVQRGGPASAEEVESEGRGASPGAWSWAGVGVPIMLRVPRGVAVLIVVGLIGLLVLAYWAGHTRGDAAGAERVRAELTESPVVADGRAAPGPPPTAGRGQTGQRVQPGPGSGTATTGATGPQAAYADDGGQDAVGGGRSGGGRVIEAGSSADPREAGLNYMIVATYDPPNARELAEFLAGEHGLETVLRPVNNGRRVQVWVVDQGFTGQELGREAYLAYRSELREIGRAWRQHRPALRDTLEQMYPSRYDP